MTTLVRWNPAKELVGFNRAFDRFFESPLARRSREWPVSNNTGAIAIDVYENEDSLVVEATLPGIAPEQVDLQVEEHILTLKGEVKHESNDEDEAEAKYFVRERFYGSFARKVRLPNYVDTEAAEAKFENGILTVTLPKAEAAKRRQIPVNVN